MTILIIACVAALIGIAITYVILARKNKQAGISTLSRKRGDGYKLYHLHKFYSTFFLTKRYYAKIKRRIEILLPADMITVAKKAAKSMTAALVTAFISLVVLLLLGKMDLFYLCCCVTAVYVIFTHTLNAKISSQELLLLNQFSDFLAEVRHGYHESNMVAEAVYMTLDQIPYEIGLHIRKIYDVLNSVDVDKEAQSYNETAPNRFLQTFLATCVTVEKYGDRKIEGESQTVFLKNLNYLKQEVNIEILKQKKNNYLFSGLVYIAVAPLFCIRLIERWGMSIMQEMTSFYKGVGGIVSMVVIFLTSILAYSLINKLKNAKMEDDKEHTFLNRLLKIPLIQSLTTREINRNYTKSIKINDMLKSIGDHMGPNAFLLKRILFSITAFILCLFVGLNINLDKKDAVLNDFTNAFEASVVPNTTYLESMEEACQDLTNMYKNSKSINRDQLTQQIIQRTSVNNRTYAEMVADEVIARNAQYREIYYKWYFLVFAIAGSIIGYFIPLWMLKYQQFILQMSMEDEVIQFQTIILILMHIPRMGVEVILEWMERFAFCFKTSISECIMNYEHGDMDALEKMKNSESFEPFKRLVDNLIAVDRVGVEDAFDEIDAERDYYKEKRKQDNEIITNKKATIGKILAFAPLILTIVLEIVLPFVIMALKQVGDFSNIMGA